jgi:hypothetical protein
LEDAKELETFKVNHHKAAFKNEEDAKDFVEVMEKVVK